MNSDSNTTPEPVLPYWVIYLGPSGDLIGPPDRVDPATPIARQTGPAEGELKFPPSSVTRHGVQFIRVDDSAGIAFTLVNLRGVQGEDTRTITAGESFTTRINLPKGS